ncbi:MAG: DNA primase [Actinobacteria bacterium]|nr:DNA primase [Actinomycetota bacterium]
MAGRIRREDIEALRERVDAADVIGDHTKLTRAGARLKGLCPLHGERTPSFTVDPGQGLWHCFGCQEGGDVFSFLQKVEGLSFVEAVEQLARRVGFQLRYEELSAGEKRALGERSRLVAINATASEFFREQLLTDAGAAARDYLKGRGFGREDADRFALGFAPLEWEGLSRHLTAQRFDERELVKAGVAVRSERGRLRDRFRGRLIFPVLDLSGDVIGFGGRILPTLDYGDRDPPKYLNTAETPIYHKSKVLYGMNWARADIVRSGEALICEGYTDVMALQQAGFGNAVATCGTAVGAEHFRLLERYADRVVLAFDSDEAGGKAAERAWEIARDFDLDVRVLVLPAGQDPADLVRDAGVDTMRERVAAATPVIPFVLRRHVEAFDLEQPEGRAAAVRDVAPILASIPDPVLRHEYTRVHVADRVGLSFDVVARAVEGAGGDVGGGGRIATPATRTAELDPPRDPHASAQLEREVLRVILQRPDLVPDAWAEVTEDDFSHPRAKSVFRAVAAGGGLGADLTSVLDAAEDDEARQLIRAVALEDPTVEPDATHVAALVSRLLVRRLEDEIAWQKAELERLNPTTDPDAYRRRFEELIALEAQRRVLRAVEE